MKAFLFLLMIAAAGTILSAQTAPDKYWVQFTDKNLSPYSIARPGEFLSARSLERRNRYSIAIAEEDLPVNPAYADSIKLLGAQVLNRSRWFNAVTIQTADTTILKNIRKLSFVKQLKNVGKFKSGFTQKDKFTTEIFQSTMAETTSDTTLLRYGQASRQIGMLNGHMLHNQGFMGQGMIIAILDGGFTHADINRAFDSLRLENRILGNWDFVRNQPVAFNEHSHGAMVLSIMGGNLPGELVGAAPKASYFLLITEDTRSELVIEEDNWVAGAEYADSAGADLINSSLGYSTFDNLAQNHTYADMDGKTTRVSLAASLAARKGILVVSSAANEGNNAWHYITAPADADSIMTVGAVDSLGNYSPFSSTGPTFDRRIKPNITAQGTQTAIVGTDGKIYRGNGTSFSSPLMCGLTACLWQTNRSLPPIKIIEAIQSSASQSTHPDSLKGYGIPDFGRAFFLIQGMNPISLEKESLFRVYPNPFTERMMVDFYSPDRQEITLELLTLTGKKLLSRRVEVGYTSVNQIEINEFHSLPDGMYILRVITGSGHHEKKVLRLR